MPEHQAQVLRTSATGPPATVAVAFIRICTDTKINVVVKTERLSIAKKDVRLTFVKWLTVDRNPDTWKA